MKLHSVMTPVISVVARMVSQVDKVPEIVGGWLKNQQWRMAQNLLVQYVIFSLSSFFFQKKGPER